MGRSVESLLGPTAVQRAGEHLLGELDRLVEQITARVWQAVPGYNDILIDRTTLEQQVRPNILDMLEFMRSGRDIDDDDRARLDQLGRSRALQGVPMAAMIQSFRTAERVLIDAFCVFCIQASLNSAEQRTGIQAISAILDKVETATYEPYLATQRQLHQDHASTVAVLVARLFDGSAGGRAEIDAQAHLAGANPSLAYRCVALMLPADGTDADGDSQWDANDPTPRLTRLRRHVVTRLIEARVPAPIAGIRDDALVLLIPVTRRDALTAVRRAIEGTQYMHDVIGGAGDVYDNLFDARASCQQAMAALEVGVRQHRVHELLAYGDVTIEVMLLGNRDVSERLVGSYLGPLEQHPVLDETVQVYVGLGQSAQATADRLVVHVNTIAYRLRRIRELTGHDIREHADAVNYSLALRARKLLTGPALQRMGSSA
jgi:hypothetical protein